MVTPNNILDRVLVIDSCLKRGFTLESRMFLRIADRNAELLVEIANNNTYLITVNTRRKDLTTTRETCEGADRLAERITELLANTVRHVRPPRSSPGKPLCPISDG